LAHRVLLDECVPRGLLRDLSELNVSHVVDEGWSGRRNGELLRVMISRGFDVFVTVDRNLVFQQNLSGGAIGVIVLHARGNRVTDLGPLLPELLAAATSVKPGEVVHLGA
jgi:hypothetical protein